MGIDYAIEEENIDSD